jgi:hypothetical protein
MKAVCMEGGSIRSMRGSEETEPNLGPREWWREKVRGPESRNNVKIMAENLHEWMITIWTAEAIHFHVRQCTHVVSENLWVKNIQKITIITICTVLRTLYIIWLYVLVWLPPPVANFLNGFTHYSALAPFYFMSDSATTSTIPCSNDRRPMCLGSTYCS